VNRKRARFKDAGREHKADRDDDRYERDGEKGKRRGR
jgi:hypothetical protein